MYLHCERIESRWALRIFRGLAACLAGPDRGMFRSASDEDSEAVELAYEDLMARWSSRTIEVPEDANLDLL